MPSPSPSTDPVLDRYASPFPLPDLDDRRFNDLVAELQARLARHLPEMAALSPGDPVHALVDLFAWLTETVIYRANQIPDRQRRAFLNLLRLPLRPARPARGLISLDAASAEARDLPAPLADESLLKAGEVSFTTVGEVQPTPLQLRVLVKRRLDPAALAAEGISLAQLRAQYGVEPAAFRPVTLRPGLDPLTLAGTVDGAWHLALCLPRPPTAGQDARLRDALAGKTINIGLAPATDLDGDLATRLRPRPLEWTLVWWPEPDTRPETVRPLRLEVVADSSLGGRRAGVVRLRLPRDATKLRAVTAADPQHAGLGDTPPEPPADLKPGQVLCWLRLSCPQEPGLTLGHLGLNAVEVVGQGVARNLLLGLGTGRTDQRLMLHHADVDPDSVVVEVEQAGRLRRWTRIDHFTGCGPDDEVFTVDGASGRIDFGDGVRGLRPPERSRVRAVVYRHGGGPQGNLPAGAIRELHGGGTRLRVRHDWPTRGGVAAETLDEAERRVPAFLNHRDRAVTTEDFSVLARDNPVNPVARAEAVAGFFPGASLKAVRRNVPGVVAVFVLPPAAPAMGAAPKPSAGLLADVHDHLSARCLLGTELYVLSPQFVPVSVALSLEVLDPATEQQVFAAVERALLRYLWALPPGGPRGGGWPRGRAVEVNELRTQAGRVEGVEAVNGLRLFHFDAESATWQELTDAQALPLADYQWPELMAVAVQAGDGLPEPPAGHAPGTPAPTTPAVPVPVIPDLC